MNVQASDSRAADRCPPPELNCGARPPNESLGAGHERFNLVGLLGICPLLAAATSVRNGLGLGLATVLVALASATLIASARRRSEHVAGTAVLIMVICAMAAAVARACAALQYELYLSLGMFLPLVAVNLTLLCRAQTWNCTQTVSGPLRDALTWGVAASALLVIAGGLREISAPALPLASTPAGGYLVLALIVGLVRLAPRRWAG